MFEIELPDLTGLSYGELNTFLAQLDAVSRSVDLAKAAIITEVERTKGFKHDGQHSPTTWLRATLRCSTSEALRLHRLAATITAHPEVGVAMNEGRLTACAARDLGRVHANPRVRDVFEGDIDSLLETAATVGHRDFQQQLRGWELRADRDGALKRNEDAYERRAGSVGTINETTTIDISLPGAEGYEARDIFERFAAEELAADYNAKTAAEARGETVDPAWQRTSLQRGADAMMRILRAAAHTEGLVPSDDPIINIVVDEHTFNEAITDTQPGPSGSAGESLSPMSGGTRRRWCETLNGDQLLPAEMLAAALRGRVRRVVYDTEGVVINLGRTRRLFTGSARAAVQLSGRHCMWPGCHRPARNCDSDHLIEYSNGGPTDQTNAAIHCPRHNRERNRGFTAERAPNLFGQIFIHRPDGTLIAPPRTFPFEEPPNSPLITTLASWLEHALQPVLNHQRNRTNTQSAPRDQLADAAPGDAPPPG